MKGEHNGAAATPHDNGASRPNKKAKIVEGDGDGLVAALKEGFEKLSDSIKEAAKGDNVLP